MTSPSAAGRLDPADDTDDAHQGPRGSRRGSRGLFRSSLTRRILAVNLMAPIFLAVGFLYLDTYKRALTASTFQALGTEADLIAAAIAEGAINLDVSVDGLVVRATHGINPETGRQMLRRLGNLARVRARLFDTNGALVGDSNALIGFGGVVQITDLPPPSPTRPPVPSMARRLYDALFPSAAENSGLVTEVEHDNPTVGDYPEAAEALTLGERSQAMRVQPDRGLVLSVAVPVQYYKQVVGVVMVSRPGDDIVESLFEMRLAVLEIFTFTLSLTISLSLYLAGTIARPLVRLANAADQVRRGKEGHETGIPDYSDRADELGDLSEALRGMTEALWKRMDAIEGFAADVAHEIKNPLTSLRSAVETAARLDDPAKQKRLMAVVVDDVQRLDRLITDISDASRMDAEMSRAEKEPVRLRPILETLAEIHASEAEDQKLTIRVEGDPQDSLIVHGMEGRLVQVFRNLLVNALSFSPYGKTIRLKGRRVRDRIVISVDDEGPGLPPGSEELIFKRFYSERPADEKFGTHSGLGLAISRQIVEAHGGTIRANNRLGSDGRVQGARFVVDLPAG
ncbi:stimulus-sensing domain-containing protein [Pararhodospirillum oryzae]|nr:stimulus-sensing domain-containing protein [Pararhodospirillum oryzae]